MSDGREAPGGQLVTVSEIASLAGVRPSAVSNWRVRHADFPPPVERGPSGDLFDLASVTRWLEARAKGLPASSAQPEQLLWAAFEATRGSMSMDHAVVLVLQLLYARASTEGRDGVPYLALWTSLLESPRAAEHAWRLNLERLGHGEPLARALQLSSQVTGEALHIGATAIERLAGLAPDWGEVATAALRQYQARGGAREFLATPGSLARLQLEVLAPLSGVLYDPACGTAMVLAEAWRGRGGDELKLVGQEINESSWRLGYLHLALLGADFVLEGGDTLKDDRFRSLRANRIALDPPLGLKVRRTELVGDDRWLFGVTSSSADWLWAQVLLYHLAEAGRGVMIAAKGALFRAGAEAAVRSAIVRADLIDAVIELAPGFFAASGLAPVLLVFDRDRANRAGRVLFIDGSQLGQARRGASRELKDEDLAAVMQILERWRSGESIDEAHFAITVSVAAILARQADLSPAKYIRYSIDSTAVEGEAVIDRLARLAGRLQALAPAATAALVDLTSGLLDFAPGSEEGWPVCRLGDLLTEPPQPGTREGQERQAPALSFIRSDALRAAAGRLAHAPNLRTSANPRRRATKRGDVLLGARGIDREHAPACATVAFDEPAAYADSILLLSPDTKRLLPDYLRLLLTSRAGRAALTAATTGSVIANLRPQALMGIELPVPDLEMQQAIVARMASIESALAAVDEAAEVGRDAWATVREGLAAGVFRPRTQDHK